MSNTKAAQAQVLRDSPVINPRTGRVWQLTDAEVEPGVDALQASFGDKQKALEFLRKHKLVTPTGKLPRKYGGR
jgi:hypothetical protein